MFGYVLPLRGKLTQPQQQRYRAAYCGLCHSLKKHYGFRCRFLVNYDMTFLYLLLAQGDEPQLCRCTCPARPFCRKDCLPDDEVMHYAADLSVLLSYWKLRDALQDGSFFKRLAARSGLWLLRRPYRRAAQRQAQADAVFSDRLAKLHRLEQAQCASIDRTADAFADMLRVCASFLMPEKQRRIAELLLYHVGRYLYLVDALEDLPKDLRRGSYNPLRYRYTLQEGKLTPQDRAQLLDTVEASISMAASAYELYEVPTNRAIVHNIIYFGLPAVLRSVDQGSFRKRRTKK